MIAGARQEGGWRESQVARIPGTRQAGGESAWMEGKSLNLLARVLKGRVHSWRASR